MSAAPRATRPWTRRARVAAVAVLLLSVLLVGALIAGPPGAPVGLDGPGGTVALRRFLEEAGATVDDADRPPDPPATFVLLADLRRGEEVDRMLEWVRSGGRLVLGDPLSETAARLGVSRTGRVGGPTGTVDLVPGCVDGLALGVGSVRTAVSDASLAPEDPSARPCFHAGDGAFAVTRRVGEGEVVILGGASPLTNRFLREADNAMFAVRAVGGLEARVVFGPPLPAGAALESRGLWALLPAPAKAAVVQVVLAALLFALVRGRRLGRPVLEDPVSPVPAGELVEATGRLYRVARDAGHAASVLRRATTARLAGRLGLSPEVPPEHVVRLAAAAGGVPEERVADALAGSPPSGDEALVALGRELEELAEAVEGAATWTR